MDEFKTTILPTTLTLELGNHTILLEPCADSFDSDLAKAIKLLHAWGIVVRGLSETRPAPGGDESDS